MRHDPAELRHELSWLMSTTCKLSATLSAACGFLATIGYGMILPLAGQTDDSSFRPVVLLCIGVLWGGTSGWLAGIVWCRVMIARLANDREVRPGRDGAIWGVVVGVCATVLLHAGMWCGAGGFDHDSIGLLTTGFMIAVPAGAILGWLMGLWWRTASRSLVVIGGVEGQSDD